MMYSNIVKSPAFPLGIRVSSQTQHFKLFAASKLDSLPTGSEKTKEISSYSHCRALGLGKTIISSVSSLKSRRSFSNSSARKVDADRLPWLGSKDGNKQWSANKDFSKPGRSSWERSAKKLGNSGSAVKSPWEESAQRMERAKAKPSFEEPAQAFDRDRDTTWRRSPGPNREDRNGIARGASNFGAREIRNRIADVVEEGEEDEDEEHKPENDVVGDPRWDRIKSRFSGTMDRRGQGGLEDRPESRKWERQESWGRKTWKEATTESTVPKMIGEGVYGIGPVLAALSAGRRELYALYVQEGLGVSNNSRKKKDKKGIEKILKTAEKLSLTVNRVSKHDLNMVVDSRPHQGLVLDASPLEMVKMTKLDRENDKNALWVALDEVMDPMNLGAIVRSAYFFGAAGVVLCAKNSAPLSGVVSKASAGSLELMELRYCKNMMQFLIFSAENGWRVLGGSVSPRAVPVNEVEPGAGPTILVLGSEGAGLRPLVEKSCTRLVRIPANVTGDIVVNHGEGGEEGEGEGEKSVVGSAKDFRSFLAVESLNVSVAAGVLLHHLIGDNYYENGAGEEIDDSTTTEMLE